MAICYSVTGQQASAHKALPKLTESKEHAVSCAAPDQNTS